MKRNLYNLLARLVTLGIIIVFLTLCYYRKITNSKNLDAGLISYQNGDIQKDEIIYYHQNTVHSKINDHSAHSYLDIEPLERLVEKDIQGGPIIISDINIQDFLLRVEKDNNKWNISSLTKKQIKDITNTRGKVVIIPMSLIYLLTFKNI